MSAATGTPGDGRPPADGPEPGEGGAGLTEPLSEVLESSETSLDMGDGFAILPEASDLSQPEFTEALRTLERRIERDALAFIELLRDENSEDLLSREFAGE